MLDRRNVQPAMEYLHDAIGGQAAQMEAMGAGTSHEDLFERLEDVGTMLRIYPDVRPTMFHYATISRSEVAALAIISDVIRMGHVHAIEPGRMMLAQGDVTLPRDTSCIDCTASAAEKGGGKAAGGPGVPRQYYHLPAGPRAATRLECGAPR